MKEVIKKIKWDRIITAVLAIIIGGLFIALPKTAETILCTISGIMLILVGVVSFIASFAFSTGMDRYSLMLGIALMLAGVFCIVRPNDVMTILAAIFGIFIVIDGTITLIDAIDCARAKIKGWFLIFLIAIASIAVGAVVMFVGADTMMWIAGIGLILEGIIDIIVIAVFSARIKQAKVVISEVVKVEELDDIPKVEE